MQVAKGLDREFTHGALAHLGEYRVTNLGERHHHDAAKAVGHHKEERDSKDYCPRTARNRQGIGSVLECVRRPYGNDLGCNERHHGQHDANFKIGAPRWPKIGEQAFERLPLISIAARKARSAYRQPTAH